LISLCIVLVSSAAFNPVSDCVTYCGAIAANSTICGNNFVGFGFLDANACAQFCGAMGSSINLTVSQPYNFQGDTTNTSGNTMGCRPNRLLYANSTNNASFCAGASIHGGGICGGAVTDLCGTYCVAEGANCPETFSGTYNAPPSAPTGFQGAFCALSCLNEAATWSLDLTYPMNATTNAANTLTCRIYHATAAYTRPANTVHCTHATYLGGGTCVGSNAATAETTAFCTQVFENCATQVPPPYVTMAQCLSDAATYSVANINANTSFGVSAVGDNLACRFYHASYPSFSLPATHCPHTGWSSAACNNGTERAPTPAPTVAAPTTASGNQGATTSKPSSAISLIASLALIVLACVVALF